MVGNIYERTDRGTRYKVLTTTKTHALCAVRQPNGRYSSDPNKYARIALYRFTPKHHMALVKRAA